MIYYYCDLSRDLKAKASMFDNGTENFRPEGGVIYGSNACHEYLRRYHRLRGLGRHQSRNAQNALSRRGALAPRYFFDEECLYICKIARILSYGINIYINALDILGSQNIITSDPSDATIFDAVTLIGYKNKITGDPSEGPATSLMIVGEQNNFNQTNGLFIVGGGYSEQSRANALRVTRTQVFGGTYKSTGADYAELFEWLDGNPGGEDRAGRFVTLEGDKLRLAEPGDEFILGIVSGNPSIVGDVHDDQWHGMYQQDVFGRYLWETVEIPEETEERVDPKNPGQTVTVVKRPAHTERRLAVNPEYNPEQSYTPRSERQEWDAVGMMGKLVAVDDGTCQVNGWCGVGEGGAATHSEQRTNYRVMNRLDETHVLLLLL